MTYPGGRAAPDAVPGRCPRCGWGHPAGPTSCLRCGTPLPRLRWVAHPPPVRRPPDPPPPRRRPYAGPPGYGAFPPRWGFPATVWRSAPAPTREPDPPVRRLRFAAALAVITAVTAVVAAGAEAWRFVLLLAGRTQVLSGGVVRVNDALVVSAGFVLLVAAVATAVVAVPALVRLHPAAARRAGSLPSRRPAGVAGRLVTPVVNLYGAGLVLAEIDAALGTTRDARGRVSRVVLAWWIGWVLNGVLLAAALARGLGGSAQAVADTVELHVAVDLSAAAVAALGAAVLFRFARALTPAAPPHAGWRVAAPAPTRPAARPAGTTSGPAVPPPPGGPAADPVAVGAPGTR